MTASTSKLRITSWLFREASDELNVSLGASFDMSIPAYASKRRSMCSAQKLLVLRSTMTTKSSCSVVQLVVLLMARTALSTIYRGLASCPTVLAAVLRWRLTWLTCGGP